MRRRLVQPYLPNLHFKDELLSVPGYVFEKARPWNDTGTQTLLAEGTSLKDGSNVLAKIAPATGAGAICLEREAHLLDRLTTNSETMNIAIRILDFLSFPKESGDCVVLLLAHPGLNLLGRYFPPSKVNELLLADIAKTRTTTSQADILMMGLEEPESFEDNEIFDVMDLASFIEFAIQATHCIELIHNQGLIHREVRANAFHLNAHSGLVRFAHFGNRSISLEQLGGPSALVIAADTLEEFAKRKVKEVLCYLAPEQTGSVETSLEDHRTDLYSLGIMFWTLIVGQGQMPFEGSPMEILHSIAQKRPMPVHEFRRDIPHVVATIIEKLLSKSPDGRYNSAYGLKADLLECQRRLLSSVASLTEQSLELIPFFEIGMDDKYMGFTIPNILFGREKEIETIRAVIRHTSQSHARQHGAYKSAYMMSTSGSLNTSTSFGEGDDRSDSAGSSKSDSSPNQISKAVGIGVSDGGSPHLGSAKVPSVHEGSSSGGFSSIGSSNSRSSRHASRSRMSRTRAIIVAGPAGAGKSTLILFNQAKWRSHGLWGHSKFQNAAAAPFAALLSCMSSVLRQLMIFQTDLHRFVVTLRARLGPLLHNAPLLYQGAPELKDILSLFDVEVSSPREMLTTAELRVRFQTLVEQVFSVLAEVRLLALFLDDIHEADESSLDLISALANSKSRMLILASARTEDPEKMDRLRQVFGSKSRVTWLTLEPLSFSAVSLLVSRTLHRTKEECLQLTRIIYRTSGGNPFSARNFLSSLQRHHHIVFNWENNFWTFDLQKIEASLISDVTSSHPNIQAYLTSHWRELAPDTKTYLIWASFFGSTFKADEVALVIDWDASSSSGSDEDSDASWTFAISKAADNIKESSVSSARSSMKGLQGAIAEGWLVQRARDMCTFSHDRYRQAAIAEAESLSEETIAKMSFRIVLMLLHERIPDPHRVAEHAKRCLNIIQEHAVRDDVFDQLYDAGISAWTRGAHELALESLKNCESLLVEEHWRSDFARSLNLTLKLAELLAWKGDIDGSDEVLAIAMSRADLPEDQAKALRLSSRNKFSQKDFSGALGDTLTALETLGVKVNPSPTFREVDILFEQVKNEILAVGFENILLIPRSQDQRIDLTVQLLNDAGMNAYWNAGDGFSDVIGLTTIQVALRSGICPGTAIGFFWALGAAAERRELFRFSADLGKLGLRIAEMHGTNAEKCRALVLFCSMVSGYDNVHVKANIARCDLAVKYGLSAGDRLFSGLAVIYSLKNRLFACEHLGELVVSAEEAVNDVALWTPRSDVITLGMGVLNCIRALGGYTIARSANSIFDTDNFKDSDYIAHVLRTSGNVPLALGWYNAFKVVSLYALGFFEEAAELGFAVHESMHFHPNHRHTRFAMTYHSLAMISCIRSGKASEERRTRYLKQVEVNQAFVRKWLSPSPVNTSSWVALVDAELASVQNDSDAIKLYDIAVKLATNHDWLLEEGWALYLQGSHFVRCGVEGLGSELQRRGVSRQSQWGARGIVNYLTSVVGNTLQQPLKRNIFTCDVAVQTDNILSFQAQPTLVGDPLRVEDLEDNAMQLSSADLTAILRWSKDISSDINLSSALRRLTEISTENSGAQSSCVVIAREAGDYIVATSMHPPGPCQVHENPRSVRTIADPLQRAVIQHCLNTKSRLVFDEATMDPRFASEAHGSILRAVICLPIFSNRGQTFGAVFLASKYSFLQSTVQVLTLLLQQASISISNALLFRSVQAGTRENLKMISSQRAALEEARRSREDALKATKIKSNFLASMSHELRTPFSSFYGLLDILSGTELNPSQFEIVATAKQSCELLLKIIDSILDYSKLEASALKLEYSDFAVENLIADCMELLLPMAAKKLDMSFNIEGDVPLWVKADYARIRQILMNLIGNAIKFTSAGSVQLVCSVDKERKREEDKEEDIFLKFTIHTGIGMSQSDVEMLFVPFQQADNSSTRKFGGTGLGLSISRQLVKLMGGFIGVESQPGAGSVFWFSIPVKIFESDESRKAQADTLRLKELLVQPKPLHLLISSPSATTIALLRSMLDGFIVTSLSSVEEVESQLQTVVSKRKTVDFIIVDDQSEQNVDSLSKVLHATKSPSTSKTHLIHLFTPTSETISRQAVWDNAKASIIRITKPPRKARLLQTLAALKDVSGGVSIGPQSEIAKALNDIATAKRLLYGNVLIAEDNPVAQQVLVKQLQRVDLNVIATSNGSEAVQEWEAHEPGYFSLALFDHHMPICDGIEACKRIRVLENKRKVPIILPIVALSADCQESTKQLCLSAGMNAFMSKPMRKTDLASLLSMFNSSMG